MSTGRLSKARLGRMHDVMAGHVDRGAVPGLVTLVSRRGEVHVDAIGMKASGGTDPMRRDTLFRIASMTKPVTAAAAGLPALPYSSRYACSVRTSLILLSPESLSNGNRSGKVLAS
jgi:hypothetical protein